MMDEKKLESELTQYYAPAEVPESFETGWRAAVRREESIRMTKTTKKRGWFVKGVVPAVAALVLIVGAASVSDFMPGGTGNNTPTYIVSDSNTAKRSSKAYATESSAGFAAAQDSAVWAAEEVENDYAAGAAANTVSGTDLWTNPASQASERKLVRTASVTLRTSAFEDDLTALQQLVTTVGGYLEDYYQSGDTASGRLRSATFTIRVPAARLDEFLGSASGIARVTDRSESATDMSAQYYDNETRLTTLNTKMERLQEMLGQAKKMEDIITIENAISDTQYLIDSYQSTQKSIDNRVEMSTVTLYLKEEKAAEIAPSEGVTFGKRIAAAIEAGWQNLLAFGQNLVIFLLIAFPYLLVAAVIVAVIVLIVKARRKKAARPTDADLEAAFRPEDKQ